MLTEEQIEEIARLAKTTPEIVKAVLLAHFRVRFTFVEPSQLKVFTAQTEHYPR